METKSWPRPRRCTTRLPAGYVCRFGDAIAVVVKRIAPLETKRARPVYRAGSDAERRPDGSDEGLALGPLSLARASGCDDFDTKPIEFDRLLTKIERALAAKPAS